MDELEMDRLLLHHSNKNKKLKRGIIFKKKKKNHKIVPGCISLEKLRRNTNMKNFIFFLGFLRNQTKPKAKKIIH